MSHTVLVEINCKPGMGAEYNAAMAPLLPDTRAFAGCELVEVYVDQDNPDTVFLWEKWASRKDQEAYLAWRIETGKLDEMSKYFSADPRFVQLSPSD